MRRGAEHGDLVDTGCRRGRHSWGGSARDVSPSFHGNLRLGPRPLRPLLILILVVVAFYCPYVIVSKMIFYSLTLCDKSTHKGVCSKVVRL